MHFLLFKVKSQATWYAKCNIIKGFEASNFIITKLKPCKANAKVKNYIKLSEIHFTNIC